MVEINSLKYLFSVFTLLHKEKQINCFSVKNIVVHGGSPVPGDQCLHLHPPGWSEQGTASPLPPHGTSTPLPPRQSCKQAEIDAYFLALHLEKEATETR